MTKKSKKSETKETNSLLPLAAVVVIIIVASLLFLNRPKKTSKVQPVQRSGSGGYQVENDSMMEEEKSMVQQ